MAADRRPVGNAVVAGDPKSAPAAKSAGTNKAAEDEKPPATAASDNWKSVIGIEPLKTEIKTIRNTLTGHLQNVGKFNSGLTEIPQRGCLLYTSPSPRD